MKLPGDALKSSSDTSRSEFHFQIERQNMTPIIKWILRRTEPCGTVSPLLGRRAGLGIGEMFPIRG